MAALDFSTDHRLSDTLALQLFMLKSHLLRRGLFVAVCLLGAVVVNTMMNGAPLSDSLADLGQNAGRYVVIVLVGLATIYLFALLLAILAWRRRPKPRQIRAVIAADTITLQKDGFSYGARWGDAGLVTESRAAYLMKFNQLYMRLPKRGFAPGQEAFFRDIIATAVPKAANRLRDGRLAKQLGS
jgi:hypothetical protein